MFTGKDSSMLLPGCDRLLAIPPSNGAATDTVAITAIHSIGNRKRCSLAGAAGPAASGSYLGLWRTMARRKDSNACPDSMSDIPCSGATSA
jgi:hypothetical protein